MKLPNDFIRNIEAVDGDAGRLWLSRLPAMVEELRAIWCLDDLTPVPNLTYNFVATARFQERVVVLKMSPLTRPLSPEVRWLRHFSGIAPEAISHDESRNAFLMERCRPGLTLLSSWTAATDDEAVRRICNVIRALGRSPVRDDSFKHLSEQIPDLKALSGFSERRLQTKAESLFTELTIDRSCDRLLHGDLHHDNILQDGTAWKPIDPHGYVGDPVAETGVMIYNPLGSLPMDGSLSKILDRRMRIMAEELSYDLQKIRAWCFCKTMLSAAWNVADFPSEARREIALAEVIDSK